MADSLNLIISFLAGGLIGVLCAWLLLPARRQQKDLQQQLNEARAELKHQRDEVDQHFLRTAELVNNLSQSYRDVHEHLADGARKLCSEEGRRLARAKSLEPLPGGRDEQRPVQPPLDYAPSHKGTLSEDFGLNKRPQDNPFPPVDASAGDQEDDAGAVNPPRDYAEGCEEQGCPPEPAADKSASH